MNWFEIPVYHMDRAVRFYSDILRQPIKMETIKGMPYACLPDEIGGALARTKNILPSPNGTIVFLDCGHDLSPVLARVEVAGGRILTPRTEVGGSVIAVILDSEGNRVGLQSRC